MSASPAPSTFPLRTVALFLAACGSDLELGPSGAGAPSPALDAPLHVRPSHLRLTAGQAVTATVVAREPGGEVRSRLRAPGVELEWMGPASLGDHTGTDPEASPRWPVSPTGRTVEVRFNPPEEPTYVEGTWTLELSDGSLPRPVVVPVRATSFSSARVRPRGPATVELGTVPLKTASVLRLRNEGSRSATTQLQSPDPRVQLRGGAQVRVPALHDAEIAFDLRFEEPGPFSVPVYARTGTATVEVLFRGEAVAPRLSVHPEAVEFGVRAPGSRTVRSVELRNVGGGRLELGAIVLSPGASPTFALEAVPEPRPLGLEPAQVRVRFEPKSAGRYDRELRVQLPDRVAVIPLRGTGLDCATACPLPRATPACAAGECAILRCDPGWFDANGRASDGCECEDGRDPGEECATARHLERVYENDPATVVEGVIAGPGDVDLVRFHADDGFHVFREDFDVRVELLGETAGLEMCVHRRGTDEPQPECLLSAPTCPADGRYRYEGRYGREDAADFVVRLQARPDAPAACIPYRLQIRNG